MSKKIGNKLDDFIKNRIKKTCFAKGTLVYTSSGHIPIEEIKIGALVYAKDPYTGEFSEKKVLELSLQKTYILYNINIGNENFGVTAEHPFWVYGKGFVAVEDLVVGDEIVTHNKQNTIDNCFGASSVNKIEKVFYKELQHVYNFTVEDMHTYFVGESCVFVHNAGCKPGPIPSKLNYRDLYKKKYPNYPDGKDWQVHHTLPQKHEDIMKNAGINIHETEYLRGVLRGNHQEITNKWLKWDKSHGGKPTAQQIIDFAKVIDKQHKQHWFK